MSSHCTPGTSTETENNDSSNVLPFDASLSTNTLSSSLSTSSSVTGNFSNQPTLEWSLNKISSFSS